MTFDISDKDTEYRKEGYMCLNVAFDETATDASDTDARDDSGQPDANPISFDAYSVPTHVTFDASDLNISHIDAITYDPSDIDASSLACN